MNGGVQHRSIQTCGTCGQEFAWSPAVGLCPYCDLSDRARQTGPYGDAEPCPPTCCSEQAP